MKKQIHRYSISILYSISMSPAILVEDSHNDRQHTIPTTFFGIKGHNCHIWYKMLNQLANIEQQKDKQIRNGEHNLKMSMPSSRSHQGRRHHRFEGSISCPAETFVYNGGWKRQHHSPYLKTKEGTHSLYSWLEGRCTIRCRKRSPKLGRILMTQGHQGRDQRDLAEADETPHLNSPRPKVLKQGV
jgi:hypothetical protein